MGKSLCSHSIFLHPGVLISSKFQTVTELNSIKIGACHTGARGGWGGCGGGGVGGRGLCTDQKNFKKCMKLNYNFHRGMGLEKNPFRGGGMDSFHTCPIL